MFGWVGADEDDGKNKDNSESSGLGNEIVEFWFKEGMNDGVYGLNTYECEDFEFFRGNWGSGVRDVIEPLDPDNPYGCGKSTVLPKMKSR